MSLYQLSGVKQVFDGKTVLDIDHLEVSVGKGHALLGPNGSGKTTLLHILAFLSPPSSGQVRFKGQAVDWKEKSLVFLRRQVVLVEQHPIMFSTTVLKNVEYGLRMRGQPAGKRRRTALECLERVGMKDFVRTPARVLSGGETQRVAIARALACEPEVMLFDEPTASVDVENQGVIESVIRDIQKEKGITVVFSTHKRLEATRLGQNMIFMLEGGITGPGGENILSGTVVRRHGRTVCVVGAKTELEVEAQEKGPCRIFIRPDKVKIYSPGQATEMTGRNLLPGRVLQMSAEEDCIQVLLDVGFILRARTARKEIAASGIVAGDEVLVELAAGAVQLGT